MKHFLPQITFLSYIIICVFQLHFGAAVTAFGHFDEEMRGELNFQYLIRSRTHGRINAGVVECANKDATMRRALSRVMAVTFSLAPLALWFNATKRPLDERVCPLLLLLTIMMFTVVSSKVA